MRIDSIMDKEENRIDLFILRTMGQYTYLNKRILAYFNPRVDFLNLYIGLELWVPDSEDIATLTNIRGFYTLVR